MSENILGYSLKEWDDFLDGTIPTQAEKALNYLDGDQEKEIIKVLDCPNKGRRQWKSRGIIPRFRNLVKPIVSHSGMIFKDTLPTFVVYDKNSKTINQSATDFLYEEFSKIELTESFITLDETTRLLKTTLLLTMWDTDYKELVNILLHRGNSAVVLDKNGRDIIGLVYETSEDDTYRIITKDFIYDYKETGTDTIEHFYIYNTQPNPFGIVPVTPFYDTNLPRTGFWLQPGMDLVNINELYNLHITDAGFSLTWAKLPTLFTNCKFEGTGQDTLTQSQEWGQKLPTMVPDSTQLIGGPSKAIILDSNGVDSPFADYKAPVFDISSMDSVINGWVYNVANDWSVRLDVQGQGRASSGFQLVVEELPNLELRKQRQKMFTMAFKRWYHVLATVLNTVYGTIKLPLDAELYVDFNDPILPVEAKEQEEIWSKKITEGRASLVDYFMEVKGLSVEEAISKIEEINKYDTLYTKKINTTNVIPLDINNGTN